MCLWKEPTQVSEGVVLAEFGRKYHIFLNLKTDKWNLKILWFIYWNDLTLGSVETYFLQDGAYMTLKGATPGF